MCDDNDDEFKEDQVSPESLGSLLVRKQPTIVLSHPGIQIKVFLNQFQHCHLPSKFRALLHDLDTCDDLYEDLTKIWNEVQDFVPGTFEDLLALQKLCCGLALLPISIEMTHLKMGVIHKVFKLTSRDWDVCPVKIHAVCKELQPFLSNNRNLMYFIRLVASCSRLAFYISCCLAWSAFYRLLGKEVKMYRLHEFQEMIDALKTLDLQKVKDKTNDFYSLLDVVVFLINVIVLRKSDEMICERYRDNFVCKRIQIEELLKWSGRVEKMFQLGNNENEDWILINELVYFDLQRLKRFLEDSENDIDE